jgi:hypothetical protein
MPFLLALPVFYCVALAHRYLQIYAPSNLLARSCPGSSGTYHRRRRQDRLGRLTPIEFELIMSRAADQAA